MPDYEYSQPRSFGYVTGQQYIRSPWASEPCEACILAVSFGDVGSLLISPEDGTPLGPSQTQATNPEGVPGFATFTQQVGANVGVATVFFTLPKGTATVVVTVSNAHTCWFTIVFRRAIGTFRDTIVPTQMAPEAEDQWHTINARLANRERAQADVQAAPGVRTR